MNAMTEVTTREIQWFAVRMKPNASGGPRTAIIDVKKEQYTNRAGNPAFRKVKGTGRRVFLPEHLLKRVGFEVFLPVKKVLRIKNRFTKEKHLVYVPLLADWMFVGWSKSEIRWLELMSFDVVAGVMGTGGRPIRMSDKTVMRLMQQYCDYGVGPVVKRRIIARHNFNVGQVACVLGGPFEGFDFRIDDIKGSKAKGLIEIFGRDTPLEVELGSLAS